MYNTMLDLLNKFGMSNSPELVIKFCVDDHGISHDDIDSSSSALPLLASENTEKSHTQFMEDSLVSYYKIEVLLYHFYNVYYV